MKPGLYLCATPIGNLDDITVRVANTLREVDAIYCEDTRHTLGLLNHLSVKKPLVSCHEHNEETRAAQIIEKIREGASIAYVSDAGMPCISDPGERLVSACIRENVYFTVLPGASASLTALSLSGLGAKNACFIGFLPREGKERREAIAGLSRHRGALIIYESPQRVSDTFADLCFALGDRTASLSREITKLYEQTVRGTLSELAKLYCENPPKGECVIVVSGYEEDKSTAKDPREMLSRLIADGLSAKDAAKQASAVLDIPRNEAYTMALEIKKGL